MGMFDAVFSELTCPFCGHEYKYNPPSHEQAKATLDKWRKWQEDEASKVGSIMYDFEFGDKTPEEIQQSLEDTNSEEAVQHHIGLKTWGLCEIQTKEFECQMDEYFIGDTIDMAHLGHYYIAEYFVCKGCCYTKKDNRPYRSVNVWLEMDNKRIASVQTVNPLTREPERWAW